MIKIIYTEFGIILGEIIEHLDNSESLTVKNPLTIQNSGNGQISINPVLLGTTEKEINIPLRRLLLNNYFEPETLLVNKYNEIFGVGIILPTNPGEIIPSVRN